MDHRGGNRRQCVIVAKFDFLSWTGEDDTDTKKDTTHADGHSIIFVHNGHYSHG